jgi:hypothetical protein
VARAETMYRSGAYVHWYARHGVGRDVFDGALAEARGVVEAYRELDGWASRS